MLVACLSVLGSCDAAVGNLCAYEWIFSSCGITPPSFEADRVSKRGRGLPDKRMSVWWSMAAKPVKYVDHEDSKAAVHSPRNGRLTVKSFYIYTCIYVHIVH